MKQPLFYLGLSGWPILKQLQLEEALLRTDKRNFFLANFGSPPAIVMGISGKSEELLNETALEKAPIPVLRRFSGGGTVVVDENTLFFTFLFSKETHPFPLFPEPIHRWAAEVYQTAWNLPAFSLRENDYAIGDKKCGGNAQYITKDRWLHHTSFLWDYRDERMDYLKLPAKRPQYRLDRGHSDFLCRLSSYRKDPAALTAELKEALSKRFSLIEIDPSEIDLPPHRQATRIV